MEDQLTAKTEPTERKGKTIKIGNIVAVKNHPYQQNNTKIKIAAYNHFTPPLMVVIEKKSGKGYSADTGEKDCDLYNCIYYSTTNGAFEKNWFKGDQLKSLEDSDESFYKDNRNKSLSSLKKDLIGKLVTLRTVDLELQKKQVYQDSFGKVQKLKEKNLLDFLPPIGTIISVSTDENHSKYHEKSGKKVLSKNRVLLKLRWFNNKASKFSEEDVPLSALKETIPHEVLDFNRDEVYLYSQEISLEGNEKTVVTQTPIQFQDIIFSHYYYEYRFKNLFTGKWFSIPQDRIDRFIPCPPTGWDSFKENWKGSKELSVDFFTADNESFWKNAWFQIGYLDKKGAYTHRIIYISDLLSLKDEKKKGKIAKANCLLRDGAERNFRTLGILYYKELSPKFKEVFVSENQAP